MTENSYKDWQNPSGGAAILAGASSQNSGTVSFANANGVSFGMANGVITATVTPGAAAGMAAISAGTTQMTSGTAIFANSNNVSFGVNGNSITASFNQTNQTIGNYLVGNTSNSSSSTVDARSLSISAGGNISVGWSGGSLFLSTPIGDFNSMGVSNGGNTSGNTGLVGQQMVFAGGNNITLSQATAAGGSATITISAANQTNQSMGVYAQGNTTGQSTSSTVDARSLSFQGAGNISIGMSAGSVVISATGGGGGGAALSAGTQSGNTGTILFANSNGVTFGMSGSTQITASVAAQSNQTIGGYAVGNTTGQSSSSTIDARSLSFSGAGAVSVGYSAGQVVISAAAGAQSNQTMGVYASSQTTGQSSSTTVDARSLSLVGQGIISIGASAGSVLFSASTAAQTNQTVGFYASSQTTGQSSSTTLDARSLSFVGLGIISVGASGGSILISAPNTTAATLLSAGISTNGNTAGNTGLASAQLVLAGGNNVTLSGSTNAGSMTVTVSAANQTNQTMGMYAVSNTTQSSSGTADARSMSFAGAGAVSVGVTGGTVVISGAAGGQTNQTMGIYASSQTTGQSSSTTVDARSLSLVGQGIISIGASAGSVLFSASTVAQTNQTVGLYALGNTTQNSSTTLDARSLSFNGLGELTVGYSNGSIQLSAPPSSIGVSTGGNTAGNTGTYSGQVVFAGGANITLSVATAAGGAQTISIAGGAGGAGAAISAGTQSTNGGTVVFSNSNNVSFGMSNSSVVTASYALNVSANGGTSNGLSGITFSNSNGVSFGLSTGAGVGTLTASVAAQSNQSMGIYASSQTTAQSSSSTVDARSISFVGAGNISVGLSAGSVYISGADAAQTNQTLGLYAVGNTTQNSSTTLDARTVSFNGLGAMTVGFSNGSVQMSAPATSSLVGVADISISTNGSTISISRLYPYLSYFEPEIRGGGTTTNTLANGTVYMQPFFAPQYVSMYRMLLEQQVTTQPQTTFSVSASVSAGNASSGTAQWSQLQTYVLFSRQSTGTNASSANLFSFASGTWSAGIGMSASCSWSTNASSATVSVTTSQAISFISQIGSGGAVTTTSIGTSGSTTFSSTSNAANSFSSSFSNTFASQYMSGVRPINVPMAQSLSPGEYWMGLINSTATASTNFAGLAPVISLNPGMVGYTTNTGAYADFGASSTNNSNVQQYWGSYSSSGNTTTTFAGSQVSNMSNVQTWFNAMAATK